MHPTPLLTFSRIFLLTSQKLLKINTFHMKQAFLFKLTVKDVKLPKHTFPIGIDSPRGECIYYNKVLYLSFTSFTLPC